MKKLLVKCALILMAGVAGLSFFPSPAAATFNQPLQVEHLTPAPTVVQPIEKDFSDAEFEQADQKALGPLSGGEVIIFVGGGLLLLLILILLIIFLID